MIARFVSYSSTSSAPSLLPPRRTSGSSMPKALSQDGAGSVLRRAMVLRSGRVSWSRASFFDMSCSTQ
eukprot:2854993-Pyramimonas_sp.AAC.1